ncbi:MAG: ABC-2 type transport system ATP-binding protein [Pirellulaceae bacterium]|jgi:ABC-2 type transport system ATP-binding protein
MNNPAAIVVSDLSHAYGSRKALCELDLQISIGERFAFLGPNGGGKTTLFRLLSTLIQPQSGSISIFGFELPQQAMQARAQMGVVFQAPSLDKKLTVLENIRHQAALYGLSGDLLKRRQTQMMKCLGIEDRANEYTEKLSGGLRRRVELAKGMIHHPRLLLLDEPSTGLDPGARSDLWNFLKQLQQDMSVTIVFTTHLLEEADQADRIAILDEGKVVALDTPDALRATVGGDAITIDAADPESLVRDIREMFDVAASIVGVQVRLELPAGQQWIPRLMDAFPGRIKSITLGRPTLEDVFISKTGHRFWRQTEEQ